MTLGNSILHILERDYKPKSSISADIGVAQLHNPTTHGCADLGTRGVRGGWNIMDLLVLLVLLVFLRNKKSIARLSCQTRDGMKLQATSRMTIHMNQQILIQLIP